MSKNVIFFFYLTLIMFILNNIHKILQFISFLLFLLSMFNFLFGNDNILLDNISDIDIVMENNTPEIKQDINSKSEYNNNYIIPPSLSMSSKIKSKCYWVLFVRDSPNYKSYDEFKTIWNNNDFKFKSAFIAEFKELKKNPFNYVINKLNIIFDYNFFGWDIKDV